ncbi:PD-(D/E)XK nuclease family protein [Saliphagus sp. LR7]|uniref:PD-(D/E)XK nuclease family protein n=1 Tax=Saliphagus sp. LR7 TaxID=2282654 RepID=UPI000DF826C2|nr:PD-(D/E)XK nuclease family protein [Saliphagus sp. LR7]
MAIEPTSTAQTDGRIDFDQAVQTALEDANDPTSHVERDAETFHPSQICMCERRAYCSKLGLDDQSDILGVFQTGTLIHEFLEERFTEQFPDAEVEREIEYETEDVRFVGRADCYDPATNAVYDWKTRSSWYNFDPPVDRHLDQIHVYMAALGADYGQVVYLNKGSMEVRTWPEDGLFEFDPERFEAIVEKATRIRDAIDAEGIAESAEEIPFEKCDCYFCSQETLDFD